MRRKKRFSALNQTQTRALHREISKKYSELTEAQLIDEYRALKAEHDNLRSVRSEMLEHNRQRSLQRTAARSTVADAQASVARARNAERERRGIVGMVASFFSTPQPSAQEIAAQQVLRAASTKEQSITYDPVPEGVRRRAHLYHELKVISALRKKLRERRLKAAARKKAKKTEG